MDWLKKNFELTMFNFHTGLIKIHTNLLPKLEKSLRVLTYLKISTIGLILYLGINKEEKLLLSTWTYFSLLLMKMLLILILFKIQKKEFLSKLKLLILVKIHLKLLVAILIQFVLRQKPIGKKGFFQMEDREFWFKDAI